MAEVIPFRIDVPEAELADLRRRLRQTRWPEREPVADWSQGVPLAYLSELCDYWADGYDWRASEARLNGLPQVDVPVGCSVVPRELLRPSRRWAARRFTDIRYWNEPVRGGHFAAFEQPDLFVEEMRAFFRLVR